MRGREIESKGGEADIDRERVGGREELIMGSKERLQEVKYLSV